MRVIKSTAFGFLLFSINFCQGQTSSGSFQAKLPTIVPPSPEVASLVKAGDINTGLHTGSANAGVSLFSLSAGAFTMPVSLTYSSNGIKVNDIPSRVGLGWNLVAGGSISRIVHDEPDGESTYLPPVDLFNQNSTLLSYLQLATAETYDTEFDEYNFSVNGLSGKFYLDAGNIGKVIQHSNVRIEKQGTVFIVTGPDGVKYFFGENSKIEKTRTITLNSSVSKSKVQSATWFLTRILTPDGETINFFYNTIFIRTFQGPSQSVILQVPSYTTTYNNCGICQGHWANATMNVIDYDTYYLTQITSTNGSIIDFTYGARTDNSGDNRLTQVTLSTTNGETTAKLIKKYQFEYLDISTPATTGDQVKRFYLKKVKAVSTDNILPNTEHVMDYNDPDALPSISSFAQDHFGYYNGKINNANFFPVPYGASNYVNASQGGDRSPDFAYSQKGSLQKITYPTGGYQQFYFESNTLPGSQTTTSYNYATVIGNGTTNNPPLNVNEFNTYFSVISTQTASVSLSSFRTPGYDLLMPPSPTGPDFVIRCWLWNTNTNTIIGNWGFTNYSSAIYQASLQPGINYRLQLKVYGGETNAGTAILSYDPTTTTANVNAAACGVRVSQIKSYDPVANNTTNKFYTYASLAEITKSSGVGTMPEYQTYGILGGVCATNTGQNLVICTEPLQVSSSSINPTFTFGGSPVAYRYVIEADDYYMQNGGIEHTFSTSTSTTGASNILGTNILAGPLNISPDMNGMEEKTVYFKKSGNSNITLKEVTNTYDFDTRVNSQLTSVITKKRFEPPFGSFSIADNLSAFDLGQYFFSTAWIHLSQTITKEYDQNGSNPLTSTVTYQYNNTTHLQPTQTQTTNSLGSALVNTSTYPSDYPSGPVSILTGKYIITPVIESVTLKDGVAVSTVKTDYKDWFNDAKIVKPEIIKAGKGGSSTLEARVRYHSYDATGNPLEVSKENDARIAYIWDYNKTYPVAEVKTPTAISAEVIAYTSFEADGSGNWTIPSAYRDNTTAITGKKSYSVGNSVSKSGLDAAKTYVVSYWSKKTTAYTITGTISGYPVQGRNVNGWYYYEHKVTGQTTISISGIGLIDELRLYPDKAFMTTYTYDPLIGTTAQCDANNRISYYEYDGFNRLIYIRDQDKNIVKKICYNYAGQAETCTSSQQATNINLTSTNIVPGYLIGYTASYYNTVTGQTYSFTIPAVSGLQALGTLPEGNYNLTISKPGANYQLTCGSGCNGMTQSGITVTFFNISVSASNCNSITLDLEI